MSDDLRNRYADAIKAAAVDCDGNCGRTEQECADHVELVWAGTARQDRPDEVTWVQGTTTALADVMRAVRDTELERVSGYAERMEEMVIEKDREATQWAERLHKAEAKLARFRTFLDEDFRQWCSPDGIAATYAPRLLEILDRDPS